MTEATPNKSEIRALFDATAIDKSGDKLGSIKEVFVDDRTGQPTFVEVGHGLFGMSSSLVPLRGSSLSGDTLNLGFAKDEVESLLVTLRQNKGEAFGSFKRLTIDDARKIYLSMFA